MIGDEDASGVCSGGVRRRCTPVSRLLLLLLLHGWAGLHKVGHGGRGGGKVVELEGEVQGLDIDRSIERVMVSVGTFQEVIRQVNIG